MEETLTFSKKYINKNKFHMHKKPLSIYGINIKKIILYNKYSYSNKHYIGCDTNYSDIIPLYITLPQINALSKYCKNSKKINLFVYDKDVLKNMNLYGIKLVV